MQADIKKRVDEMFGIAAHQHRAGQLGQAERLYKEILAIAPDHADSWHLLGVVALQAGRPQEAETLIHKAIALKDQVPSFHTNLGNALRAQGRLQPAAACYQKSLTLNPSSLDVLYNLAVVLQEQGRLDEAAAAYTRVISAKSDHAAALSNLGNVWQAQGKFDAALASYERALRSRPDFPPALVNRGNLLKAQGKLGEAMESYRRALSLNPRYPEAHNNLGLVLLQADLLDEALDSFERAVSIHPGYLEAQRNLGNALRERGRAPESLQAYRRALSLDPNDAEARLGLAMAAIPVYVESSAESVAALASFEGALAELGAWSNAGGDLDKAVGGTQPFYLAYRPVDLTACLSQYGDLVSRASAKHSAALAAAPPARARLRLGIVCGYVRDHHPVWTMLLRGLIEQLSRDRFEVFVYHTGAIVDEETQWTKSQVDRLVQGPKSTAQWLAEMRADAPDIIFYPEVGMDPIAAALAAERVAPLQAVSWGHPVTSGLPTLDVYFSGELLESRSAEGHYREKLMRLPGTGVYTRAPSLAADPWDPPTAGPVIRFALPHQPIKFDPADDHLLVRIAQAVGRCEFWLAAPGKLGWATAKLMARLARAFRAEGLDPDLHLRLTPWMPRAQFLGFLDRMDVYLDCPAFSGYTTAWQALHRGVPIVTLEGAFLRQRLAAGLLRRIGVVDGIVSSADEYCRLATQFASTASHPAAGERRREIARLATSANENLAAIRALEAALLAGAHRAL